MDAADRGHVEEAQGSRSAGSIDSAQVVLPCSELQPTLDFFVERLGFRLERISPADDPRQALISGHGMRVLLRRGDQAPPVTLFLTCDDPSVPASLRAPNGTRIEFGRAKPELVIPDGHQELLIARAGGEDSFGTGRAGMGYRDLIAGRLGGRFIASHIRISDGGPVPDNVHFHEIRFQMIYCRRGWVQLVYEDQGPPFRLEEGDAVLQPPGIRHRVLESSPGLEVIEVACPAEHDTYLDHELALPTPELRTSRDFGGQRFWRHGARKASWIRAPGGLEFRDLGLCEPTGGLAQARVYRRASEPADTAREASPWRHQGELFFLFLLEGSATFACEGRSGERLASGDSMVLPAGVNARLTDPTHDLLLLQLLLPAES